MFVFGGVCAILLHKVNNPGFRIQFKKIREALVRDAENIDWVRFGWIGIVCSFVFLFGFYISYIIVGEIPAFAPDPDKIRIGFITANFLTSITWFFGPIAFTLIFEFLLFSKQRDFFWWSVCGIGVFSLLVYLTLLTRVDLFRFFVFAIILFHYGKRNFSFKDIVVIGFFGIVAFSVFFLIRVDATGIESLNQMVKVKMPAKFFWASQIYSYIVSNLLNFDFAFKKFIDGVYYYPLTWVYELAKPIFFLTHVDGAMMEAFGLDGVFNESINKIRGLNSTLFIWHFYKDFAAFGTYVLTFLTSFFSMTFYYNTLLYPTLFRVSLCAIFVGLIFFSFTTAFWTMWFIHATILLLAVAHKKISI